MRIVVDTNIIFSAILNSTTNIGKILLQSAERFQFFSCNYLRAKIKRHHNRLLKLTKLSDDQLTELIALVTTNVTFIDERLLSEELLYKTEILLESIDPDDTPFVAPTKHLDAKLWTGDIQLYNGLKKKRFKDVITTTEIYVLMNSFEND